MIARKVCETNEVKREFLGKCSACGKYTKHYFTLEVKRTVGATLRFVFITICSKCREALFNPTCKWEPDVCECCGQKIN